MGFCLLCGPSTKLDCLIRSQQKINLFQFTSRPTFIEGLLCDSVNNCSKNVGSVFPAHFFFKHFCLMLPSAMNAMNPPP